MLAKIATLEEIDRAWSLLDLMDAHEALDIQQEADDYMQKESESKRVRQSS